MFKLFIQAHSSERRSGSEPTTPRSLSNEANHDDFSRFLNSSGYEFGRISLNPMFRQRYLRWQHLSRMKDDSFCYIKLTFSREKHSRLSFGTCNAIYYRRSPVVRATLCQDTLLWALSISLSFFRIVSLKCRRSQTQKSLI